MTATAVQHLSEQMHGLADQLWDGLTIVRKSSSVMIVSDMLRLLRCGLRNGGLSHPDQEQQLRLKCFSLSSLSNVAP